jgi:hypothetical protein
VEAGQADNQGERDTACGKRYFVANVHFGNLADVFKHVVLGEVLETVRPAEYWESHVGRAVYEETGAVTLERVHGVHTFWRLSEELSGLRQRGYGRALRDCNAQAGAAGEAAALRWIPGSALVARRILAGAGTEVRRFLLCDTDAESLMNVRETLLRGDEGMKEMAIKELECVQDDGVSVLRGAWMLLPEAWAGAVTALLDPYEIGAVSEAQITPLELACEVAARGVRVLLFYTFNDEAARARQRDAIGAALGKVGLAGRGGRRFEGALKEAGGENCPTQWGFGMLGMNLPAQSVEAVERALRALERAYEGVELEGVGSGAWRYSGAAV